MKITIENWLIHPVWHAIRNPIFHFHLQLTNLKFLLGLVVLFLRWKGAEVCCDQCCAMFPTFFLLVSGFSFNMSQCLFSLSNYFKLICKLDSFINIGTTRATASEAFPLFNSPSQSFQIKINLFSHFPCSDEKSSTWNVNVASLPVDTTWPADSI